MMTQPTNLGAITERRIERVLTREGCMELALNQIIMKCDGALMAQLELSGKETDAARAERDALAAELKALRARAIELEAETKSSEEMQTLKFCEREWSTERAAMMNTINALRNCGDAHPIPVRELTDEDIQRLWDKHGLDDYCDANGFARAIERHLKGEGE